MLKRVSYLLFVVLMMSCIPETPSVPDDVIPQDKMVDILEDVQVIEAVRQRGVILPKDMDPDHEAMRMYHRMFEEYQINDSLFRKSFEWYEAHPKMLAQMYDEVLVRLSEEQALARQSLSPNKVKTDSTIATDDNVGKPR